MSCERKALYLLLNSEILKFSFFLANWHFVEFSSEVLCSRSYAGIKEEKVVWKSLVLNPCSMFGRTESNLADAGSILLSGPWGSRRAERVSLLYRLPHLQDCNTAIPAALPTQLSFLYALNKFSI